MGKIPIVKFKLRKRSRLPLVSIIMACMIFSTIANPNNLANGQKLAESEQASDLKSEIDTEKFARVQLPFIENQGQINEKVKFYAKTFAGTAFVTEDSLVYSLTNGTRNDNLQGLAIIEKLGNDLDPQGLEKSTSVVNYFVGDKKNWRSNVPTYDIVGLGEVWPSIFVKLKVHGSNFEKIFEVQPGGRVKDIVVAFDGITGLSTNQSGELVLDTELGEISMTKPVAFQYVDGIRKDVKVLYVIDEKTYGFVVSGYDPKYTLVIDPLIASTFIGGSNTSGDFGNAMTLDSAENVFVAGDSYSSDYPTTAGAYDTSQNGNTDVIISKFPKHLGSLTASTFIGGSATDFAHDIDTDSSDNVFITGGTSSSGFPTTAGAYDTSFNGGDNDAFVAKLPNDLSSLTASTFLGGSTGSEENEFGNDIEIDSSNSVFVAGETPASSFPTTTGAYDTSQNGDDDGFVSRLTNNLATLSASTFIGGSGEDHAVAMVLDSSDTVYITGHAVSGFPTTTGAYDESFNGGSSDAFVAKLPKTLDSLSASTFIGGMDFDIGFGIKLDSGGRIFITGETGSSTFPTTTGAYDTSHNSAGTADAFVSKFTNTLDSLSASTFIGGSSTDVGVDIVLDSSSNVFVTGYTFDSTTDYPTTTGAYDTTHNGSYDGFVSKLPDTLTSLTASTFIGGSTATYDIPQYIVRDSENNIYITGYTDSTNYPTTFGAYDTSHNGGTYDVFVSKLSNTLSAGTGVFLSETVTITDATVSMQITGKRSSDTVNVADTVSKSFTKSLPEITTTSDTSDTVNVADTVSKSFTKSLPEITTTSDTSGKSSSKQLPLEQITASDIITKVQQKSLSEQATINDLSAKQHASFRTLPEQIQATDSTIRTPSKNLSEIIAITDTVTKTFTPGILSKTLTEQIVISDTVTKPGNSKSLPEQTITSDTVRKSISKPRLESSILSDDLITVLGPKIISITASDPDDPEGYFNGDTITVRFSISTNQPFKGTLNQLTKDDVDSIFTFTQSGAPASLGSGYTGKWLNPSTLLITITDSTGATPPEVGLFTLSIKSTSGLKDAGGTTAASTEPSPVLAGDFGSKAGPFIESLVADDPDGGPDAGFSDKDTMTVRFSESTNQPPASTKANLDALFTYTQSGALASLGSGYTGKYLNPSTLLITITDSTGATPPEIGGLTLTVKESGNLKNKDQTSLASTSTSPLLSGSFGVFKEIIPVEAGGTAVASLPSGTVAQITLPPTEAGPVVIEKTDASSQGPTAGAEIGFIGIVTDITPPPGACATGCTFSFSFNDDDLKKSNTKLADVKIYHDRNDDGDFADDGEALATTITPSSPPGPYVAQATDSFTSKFAVGGIKPALLLAGLGSVGESAPPTLSGKAFSENEYPLTIDDTGFKLKEFSNTVSTKMVETGKPVQLKLLLYNDGGSSTIQHVALYTNLRGQEREIDDSDTFIVYDKDKPLATADPNGFFSGVNIETSQKGNKLEMIFNITFEKPMDTSDLIIRAWDRQNNSHDTKIFDAIRVVGVQKEQSVPDENVSEPTNEIKPTLQEEPSTEIVLPVWIKKNASWWADGQIDDSDFVKGVQYLVEQKVMKIPATASTAETSHKIPLWIKSNAGWWADGLISDKEFVQGLQWLVSNGIMRV